MEYIEIDDITPASYNPRRIDEQKIKKLQDSIAKLGFVMPILVNRSNNVIIAGHQRTKAAKALGIDRVPVFFCEGINQADEVKFNQIHNGTDNEHGAKAMLKEVPEPGFHELDPDQFVCTNINATTVKEICKLILKYGNVLCCVIDKHGSLIGANYAYACQRLKIPVHTSVIDYTKDREYLHEKYGEFTYDNLEKHTWVQGLAQMHRSVKAEKHRKNQMKSALYTNFVHKYLKAEESILDFGCGKGAYITNINRSDAIGIEFYNNNGKQINMTKGNAQISAMIAHLKENGQFDNVVCDSVMNSVDSMEAQNAVIKCLSALCKMDGLLFISGRCYEAEIRQQNLSKDKGVMVNRINFYDENKFTANFRKGQWYYQKFHSKEDGIELVESNGFEIVEISWGKINSSSWQIVARKVKEMPEDEIKKAIDYEFNLPLPGGKSYGRHHEVKEALGF